MAPPSVNHPSSQLQTQANEIQKSPEFPRFDVVSDESDHYYVLNRPKKEGGDCFSTPGSEVHKKILKEWRILARNLPDSIQVRVYEKRIYLLRAVIIGAAGTPYHDGLFFFDIAFPSDYPTQPPLVHYRSLGLRLNPNLYATGKVCLSLLNTWSGKKSERWNPSESTVLQVLLSIQALVLNEKPYFNEPGHGMFGKNLWEKRSQAYNENVFALSCKTMSFVLKNPPKSFESFVLAHFRERGQAILQACLEYTNGRSRVGFHKEHASSSPFSTKKVDVSQGFKASIQQLYPVLIAGFQRAGAPLGNSVEQLKLVTNKQNQTQNRNKHHEIVKKIMDRIKTALGLTPRSIKQKNDNVKGKSQ